MNGVSSSSLGPSSFGHKIRPRHCERLAIVYVRQSTPQQVQDHRESADLQYQLRRRAVELGWQDSRVLVIDDDQGCSGQSVENRPGFQRLLAEVSLGHVGIVFGREMSRLARSNKDWHQLLELCGVFQVLLADADGVYDPADFNDRLLLGLKGTMSEAELHILKSRLHQGKLNKARRGELFTCVPIGYVRSAEGGVALDPDEQARSVLHLVFAKFAELGTVPKVLAYLRANDLRIGVRSHRGPMKGQLVWRPARRGLLYDILRHPFYAGAFVYGRTRDDPTRKLAGVPRRRLMPSDEWLCLLKDRVPAYISWDQYEANRERLRNNDFDRVRSSSASSATSVSGKLRKPATLLNGRVRCGRCGGAMSVRNTHRSSSPRYACDRSKVEYGESRCQSVAASALDGLLEEAILRAVEPASLKLSIRAAEHAEKDRKDLHVQWKHKRERAEYDVQRARRQYDAVDPENRLVARELERQWEEKLADQQRLEEAFARFRSEQPRELSQFDRERIASLATDLPALWHAKTTTSSDRRAVVRLLVDRVEISRRDVSELIDVVIAWRHGTASRHVVHQGLIRYDQLVDFKALKARIEHLRQAGQNAEQIAKALNREGYRPARGKQFTGHRVRRLSVRLGLTSLPPGARDPQDLPGKDEWWLPRLAEELDIDRNVLHRWRRTGWLRCRRLIGDQGPWIIWANQGERKRLRKLRTYELSHHGKPIPQELTTPRQQAANQRVTGSKIG
jgi:DNA invertase Pin-like site-specific DNA recombinase